MRLRSKIKKPQKIDEEDDYLPSLPPARESPPRKRGLTKKEEFSLKILGTSKAFNPSLRSAAFPTLPLGTINNTLNVRANTTRAAEKKITNLEAATDFPRGVKEVLRRIAELPIQSRENTIHPIDNTNNTHDNQDALTVRDTGDRTHTVSGASIEVGTQQPHSSKILPRQIPLRRESVAENKTLPRRSGSTTAASTRQSSPANTGSVELVDLVDTPERPRAGSQSQEEVVAAIEEIFKEDPIEDRTPDSSITLVPFQTTLKFRHPTLKFATKRQCNISLGDSSKDKNEEEQTTHDADTAKKYVSVDKAAMAQETNDEAPDNKTRRAPTKAEPKPKPPRKRRETYSNKRKLQKDAVDSRVEGAREGQKPQKRPAGDLDQETPRPRKRERKKK